MDVRTALILLKFIVNKVLRSKDLLSSKQHASFKTFREQVRPIIEAIVAEMGGIPR